MKYILVILMLVGAHARASDFRDLNFGQSCDGIREFEEKQGSKSVAWSRTDPNMHTFSGRAFGREVSIAYLCKGGVFKTGHYYFPMETLDSAIASLHAVYEQFISLYGPPYIDGSPWQQGREVKDSRAVAADPREYYVSWRATPVWATITLMPDQEEDKDRRRVFIVIAQQRR